MDEKLKKKIGENIDSVWVSFETSINVGNYQSVKPQYGICINKSPDPEITKEVLYEYATEVVKEQVLKQIVCAKKKELFKKASDILEKEKSELPDPPKEPEARIIKEGVEEKPTQSQLNAIKSMRKEKGIKNTKMPKTKQDASDEIKRLQQGVF